MFENGRKARFCSCIYHSLLEILNLFLCKAINCSTLLFKYGILCLGMVGHISNRNICPKSFMREVWMLFIVGNKNHFQKESWSCIFLMHRMRRECCREKSFFKKWNGSKELELSGLVWIFHEYWAGIQRVITMKLVENEHCPMFTYNYLLWWDCAEEVQWKSSDDEICLCK